MRLVTQRVVQTGTSPYPRTGINSYCYLHPGRGWLDKPPGDLGPGKLANSIIEVDPPRGNRVRSFLDIVAPDSASSRQIVSAIRDGASLLADTGSELPWNVSHAEIRFSFNAEEALAVKWQIELKTLVSYALAVRRGVPDANVCGVESVTLG